MDFKIIAITPQKGCSQKFLKLLTAGQHYFLYHNYQISEQAIREQKSLIPLNLYTVNGQQVNISAIVGKNGSGKSTVIELLYAVIYNVACQASILPEQDDDGISIKPEFGVKASIYYKNDNEYYQLAFDGKVAWYRKQPGPDKVFGRIRKITKHTLPEIHHLFFSVVINYSHYSLNSNNHRWLKFIFHKNDGYQTPIVINPFRKDGVIDMNIEEELTHSRIVTCLLTLRQDGTRPFNELAPGKIATHLKFTLNRKKGNYKMEERPLKLAIENNRNEILKLVFEFFEITNSPKLFDTNNIYLKAAFNYICRKLFTITQRYKPYQSKSYSFLDKRFSQIKKSRNTVEYHFDANKLKDLLTKMIESPSHITFKLRQAINFVNNFRFFEPLIGKFETLKVFAEQVNQFRFSTTNIKQDLMAVIPPSFFSVDIQFENKGTLESLSSGEKQSIYSSASWMYHLINLNSVREEEEAGYRRFNCINLVFDEIELYYHPDMQRDFIQNFLESLRRLNLGHDWGINCVFITHSPFILTDIHNQCILFLNQDGLPDEESARSRTFGANIHELLKHNFFLRDGTMGTFVQDRIKSVINFLKGKQNGWSRENADTFINMVSEPFIRQGLRSMYNKKFSLRASEIKDQIETLRNELNIIEGNDSN